MVYFVFLFEVLFMFLTELMYFVFLGEVFFYVFDRGDVFCIFG